MIEGPIHHLPDSGIRFFDSESGVPESPESVLAYHTTFAADPGLHCEHCPELAEHKLTSAESGDINLCPKCLKDALDVIASLRNHERRPQ